MKVAVGSGSNNSTQDTVEIRPRQASGDPELQDFERAVLQVTK